MIDEDDSDNLVSNDNEDISARIAHLTERVLVLMAEIEALLKKREEENK